MNHRFAEIRKQLGKFVANFSVQSEDGREYIFEGDAVNIGTAVNTYAEDGSIVPLPDGEYKIQDKGVIVQGGVVSGISGNGDLLTDEQPVVTGDGEAKPEEGDEKPADGENKPAEAVEDIETYKHTIEQLTSDCAAKDARIAELEAKVRELETQPLDNPVPQTTQMSSQLPVIDDNVKGTKVEKACRILGTK